MAEMASEARHAALAVSSRRRLLAALQTQRQPMDVQELAAVVGLHVTTVRGHLEVLARAGLVHSAPEQAGRPGRPRQLYTGAGTADDDGYRKLAHVLAAAFVNDLDQGRERAERAGQGWAEEEVPVVSGLSWEQATRDVRKLFDRLGFAPRLVDTDRYRHVELDACPFRDIARAYPKVVCSVHLGLLRGALRRSGVPDAAAGLRPFVGPELCIADVPVPPKEKEQRCPEPAR